jgi:hypothetical protein
MQAPHESCAARLNLPRPRQPDYDSDTDEGFLSTCDVECTLLECLGTVDFWLLCGSISISTGTGLAFINSAAAITHSLHGSSSLTVPFSHMTLARSSQSPLSLLEFALHQQIENALHPASLLLMFWCTCASTEHHALR